MNYDAEMPKMFLGAGRERILVIDSSDRSRGSLSVMCNREVRSIITNQVIKSSDPARLRKLTSVLVA